MFRRLFGKSKNGNQESLLANEDRSDEVKLSEVVSKIVISTEEKKNQPDSLHWFEADVAVIRSVSRRINRTGTKWPCGDSKGVINREEGSETFKFALNSITFPTALWLFTLTYINAYKKVSDAYHAFKNDPTCGSYSVDDYCPSQHGKFNSPSLNITNLQDSPPPNYDYCHAILNAYCDRWDYGAIFLLCATILIGGFIEIYYAQIIYNNKMSRLNHKEMGVLNKYGIVVESGRTEVSYVIDKLVFIMAVIDGMLNQYQFENVNRTIFDGVMDINGLLAQYCASAENIDPTHPEVKLEVKETKETTITEAKFESKAEGITINESNAATTDIATSSQQPSLPSADKLLQDATMLSKSLSSLFSEQHFRVGFANDKGDRLIIMGKKSEILDEKTVNSINTLASVRGITLVKNKSLLWQNHNIKLDVAIADNIELSCPNVAEVLKEAIKEENRNKAASMSSSN